MKIRIRLFKIIAALLLMASLHTVLAALPTTLDYQSHTLVDNTA